MQEMESKIAGAIAWMQEFYPTSAKLFATVEDNPVSLVKHSLQKWKGALPENLEKHGLGSPPIPFDHETCALCIKYYEDDAYGSDESPCQNCPIFEAQGFPCATEQDKKDDAYFIWMIRSDPRPMIQTLEKTLEFIKHEQGVE